MIISLKTAEEANKLGGLTCTYQDKDLPYIIRLIPKVSIKSAMLVDILLTLDLLNIVDRTMGTNLSYFLMVAEGDSNCISWCMSIVVLAHGLSILGSRTVKFCVEL